MCSVQWKRKPRAMLCGERTGCFPRTMCARRPLYTGNARSFNVSFLVVLAANSKSDPIERYQFVEVTLEGRSVISSNEDPLHPCSTCNLSLAEQVSSSR